MRRHRAVSTLAAIAAALTLAVPAAAIDLDDPNLFGPGEGWPTPIEIEYGDSGPWVIRMQQGLADAGFRPGPIDGRYGPATRGAVYAFQKVHGLERDAGFDEADWALLDVEVTIEEVADEPDRVEVDLDKQVLYLVLDNSVDAIVPISSGNGDYYPGRGGRPTLARTPEGTYRFYRHVSGWRISYLGGLYNPFYFRGGYAIHGSSSVPPQPASHGCVRVEIHDMDFLMTQISIGMPVHVYGNSVDRTDLLGDIEA